MSTTNRAVAFTAMILALGAVIMAAMGSHLIDMRGMQSSWQVAVNIHLFSSAALIGLAAFLAVRNLPLLRWGTLLIIAGTIIFCGNIYMHVITGYTLPSVTPIGGMLMMLGWLTAALAFLRKS